MLDDLPWFCDPYIFYLTSRTLSLVRFDQIYQKKNSPLSHFNFDHEGAVPIKLQSLIQLYQFYQLLYLGSIVFFKTKLLSNLYSLSLCVPKLIMSGLFCDPKLISQLHSLTTCSQKWSHISQRGENVCTLKWSPRLWAPIIQFINFLDQFIKFLELMVFNILLNQFKSIFLVKS